MKTIISFIIVLFFNKSLAEYYIFVDFAYAHLSLQNTLFSQDFIANSIAVTPYHYYQNEIMISPYLNYTYFFINNGQMNEYNYGIYIKPMVQLNNIEIAIITALSWQFLNFNYQQNNFNSENIYPYFAVEFCNKQYPFFYFMLSKSWHKQYFYGKGEINTSMLLLKLGIKI